MGRLYHDDCLKRLPKLKDQSIDLILTDPPYGTTACKWDSVIPLEPMWEQLKRVVKPNGAIVLCAGQPFTSALIMSNVKMFKYCWVWAKSRKTGFPNANRQPLRNVEDLICFYKNQCVYRPQGVVVSGKTITRKKPSRDTVNAGENDGSLCKTYVQGFTNYPGQILSIPNEGGLHPTQKPIALMEYMIKTYTLEGETVLDFTMGSGTTGVACKKLKRKFIGIEKDQKYFEIAKERIKNA